MQAHADLLVGFVRKTTMVGSPGRLSGRVALVDGTQARPTRVSNVE